MEVLGRTAQLTMHPVVGTAASADAKPTEGGQPHPPGRGGAASSSSARPSWSGDEISGADAVQNPSSAWTGTSPSTSTARAPTPSASCQRQAACAEGDPRRIAIVLDDEIISSPEVHGAVRRRHHRRHRDLRRLQRRRGHRAWRMLIEGGALPVPVEVIEQRTVGPTLGAAAIEASWQGRPDRPAPDRRCSSPSSTASSASSPRSRCRRTPCWPTRCCVVLGSTLTLPGLAGFVLAIGLAIDANVLVFERAREEYAENPSRRAAAGPADRLQQGLDRDHRLQRHHPARGRAAVLPRLRPGQGLRRHPVDRCHRLDDLRAGHRPGAHRDRGVHSSSVAAAPGDHRAGHHRPGARLARAPQPRPDGPAPAVARRSPARRWWRRWSASSATGSTSASSSPAAGCGVLHQPQKLSADEARAGRGRRGLPRGHRPGDRRRQDLGAGRPDHRRRGGRDRGGARRRRRRRRPRSATRDRRPASATSCATRR